VENILRRIIIEPLEGFYEKFLHFLPNLLAAIVIFLVGVVLALIFKSVFARLFRAVGVDRFFERYGTAALMKKGGLREPVSALLATFLAWVIVVIFAVISMRTLEVITIGQLLESFLLYLPSVFTALLVLLFGYLLSNFLGRAALIASVNAGIRISGVIGKFVKFLIFTLAVTMALEQLGIGRETVIFTFAIVLAGVVLALAIAFGLGGRDLAKEYLEKKIRGTQEGEERDEISHL
jgi:small-conductance mechanosensitive channel